MHDTILRYVQAVLLAVIAAIAAVRTPGPAPAPTPNPPSQPPVVQPPTVPIPLPPPAPAPRAEAKASIARITFGNASCTCTFIGPRRDDGTMDVLCAAHCINGRGSKGIIITQRGERIAATKTAIDVRSDLLWLRTDAPIDHPYALLADADAKPGKRVWHEGYGVDRPRNRELGAVAGGPNADGQMLLRISVSSGDSGSGFFGDDDGLLYAVCCCGNANWVWGGAATVAARLRPR